MKCLNSSFIGESPRNLLASTWVFDLHDFSNDVTCLNPRWFTLSSTALCIYVNIKELPKNVSFLGFVCVSMWQGVYKGDDLTGYSKRCKKYWKILHISHLNPIKQSHSVPSVGTYRAPNSVIFFFLCLLIPCSNTVPTETSNKTSPFKTFNATFIRPWKEMNDSWSATIKFHVCVFQKTTHLS